MPDPIRIINQLFEMQSKIKEMNAAPNFERNFSRLFSLFEEDGFIIQDPTGEAYTESRTDCEASISGRVGTMMKITRTIKPVIYLKTNDGITLAQKGVIIVENK